MILGDQQIVVYLEENSLSRSLESQLPLTFKLEDFANGREKLFYTPKKLDLSEVEYVDSAEVGLVAVYEPWGNLCVFLKPLEKAHDLIKVGYVSQEDVEILKNTTESTVTLVKGKE